jgi:hypothetical protein
MARKLEDVLEECLIHLAAGEVTLEECLARYPEHAAELRRMLPLSEALTEGRQIRPSAEFKRRNERELLARITAVTPLPVAPRQSNWLDWLPGFFTPLYRPAYIVALITLLFLTAATTIAQTALPGDALYSWKLSSERVWRAVHPDPLNADLALTDRRVNELAQVMGRPDAETQGRAEYRRSLEQLAPYTDLENQQTILVALARQQEMLAQAGIVVPQLDRLIDRLSPVERPVDATPTPEGTLSPIQTPDTPPLLPTADPVLPTPIPPEQTVPAEILPTEILPPLPLEATPALPEATPILDPLPPLLATPTLSGTP